LPTYLSGAGAAKRVDQGGDIGTHHIYGDAGRGAGRSPWDEPEDVRGGRLAVRQLWRGPQLVDVDQRGRVCLDA
jgi:hypothetical protein